MDRGVASARSLVSICSLSSPLVAGQLCGFSVAQQLTLISVRMPLGREIKGFSIINYTI
jgi:hypothetical protein